MINRVCLLLISAVFVHGIAFAQNSPLDLQPILLTTNLAGSSTAAFSAFFEVKPDETVLPADVLAGKYDSKFESLAHTSPGRGMTFSSFWVTFSAQNSSTEPLQTFMESAIPDMDYIDVYILRENGAVETIKIGDQEIRASREYDNITPNALIRTQPGEKIRIYIQVGRVGDGIVNLDFALWGMVKYERYATDSKLLMGGFYGLMWIMFLYNLFIYFTIREKAYLYYCLYVLCTSMTWFTLNQLDIYYLWSGNKWLAAHAPKIFVPLGVFLAANFTREFLQTKVRSKYEDALLKFVMASSIIALIIGITASYNSFSGRAAHFAAQNMVLLFVAGVMSYFAGYKPARYFVIAWMMLIAGVVLYQLRNFAYLPLNLLTTHLAQLGTGMEVALLSFALADKIGILRKQKEEAELRFIEEMRRHNEELEGKVAERTQQLLVEKNKAEDATRLKDKFVSLVSHDLKSPLSGIIGYAQLLKRKKELLAQNPEYKEITTRLLNSGEAMLRVITQVLDISRLSSGKLKLKRKICDIQPVIRSKVDSLAPVAEQKGISLVNDLPAGMKMFVDEDLFGEVIGNLLSNSIKFCGKGDTIRIYRPEGNTNAVAVSDTGPGISPAILPNLFKHEVKTSTRGSAGEEGTGLGLPYSMDIVAAHDGKMHVESEPGKGAKFIVEIPVPGRFVLVVDDQEAHARIMKSIITKNHDAVTVVHAENGVEAIEELTRIEPVLIITDLHMPVMNGWNLVETLRSKDKVKSIPIVVASAEGSFDNPISGGMTFQEVKNKVMSYGVAAFISKPVIEQEFEDIMRRYL